MFVKCRVVFAVAAMLAAFGGAWAAGTPGLVSRNLSDPAAGLWVEGAFNSAHASAKSAAELPPEASEELRAECSAALELSVRFDGTGFQFATIGPATGRIPGQCRQVTLWAKVSEPVYGWTLVFKDAQGRDKVGENKLELPLKLKPGTWTRLTLPVPSTWVQPLSLTGIVTHNWGKTGVKAEGKVLLYDVRVHTDVAAIADPKELVSVSLQTGQEGNTFTTAEPMTCRLVVDSWLGQPRPATVAAIVTDNAGKPLKTLPAQGLVRGTSSFELPLGLEACGAYRLQAKLSLEGGLAFERSARLVRIPEPRSLTAAEKRRSPWGLNVHGGMADNPYRALGKAGFVWVRDYAYGPDWIARARGDDHKFGGWPWYPRLEKQRQEAGLILLPCLMGSLGNAIGKQHKLVPDKPWKTDLLRILMDFPQPTAWEIDNEYDLAHGKAETGRKWQSYRDYHRAFGQITHLFDEQLWTVEQGTAGIYPERVRESVLSGAFAQIDVVNAHHYCGIAPPELAVTNTNTGGDEAPPISVYDLMRELAAAADADGKDRQAWITEFGWDTLAVHIVSEAEQAAYLQRGYVLGLAAGLDKLFWYWTLDSKNPPSNFFDGCGLFDPKDEPKPAFAAMAGLTHFLRLPAYLGSFDFGPNSLGHAFRDGNRLVACAFRVDPRQPAPVPKFQSGKLHDCYGNALAAAPAALDIAPTWAIDLAPEDPLLRQTSFELASRWFLRATAGDTAEVRLRVRNQRATAIAASYRTVLPAGWSATPASGPLAVPAGKTQEFAIQVQLPATAAAGAGEQQVLVEVDDGGMVKRLPVRVLILPAAALTVAGLPATPGDAKLDVTLRNNSLQARAYRLRLDLPASWKAANREIATDTAAPGSNLQLSLPCTWALGWKPDEKAEIVALSATGAELDRKGIRPGALSIPQVKPEAIACDGSLADWPAAARVPAWALGRRGLDTDAGLYLAWSTAGLHVAVDCRNSDAKVPNPDIFWATDCLEFFLDSGNDKKARPQYAQTDHQFWFCPLVDAQRTYMGRWKRNTEIPETRKDIPGLTSAAKRTPKGYVMEFLLPAAMVTGFTPAPGQWLGANLNLTIPGPGGRGGMSEVFWPAAKRDGVAEHPETWGGLYLQP